jgi:hypothetical protein
LQTDICKIAPTFLVGLLLEWGKFPCPSYVIQMSIAFCFCAFLPSHMSSKAPASVHATHTCSHTHTHTLTHTQVGRKGDGLHDKYTIIIGSGYLDEAKKEPSRGAAFVYTSDSPTSGEIWGFGKKKTGGSGRLQNYWHVWKDNAQHLVRGFRCWPWAQTHYMF